MTEHSGPPQGDAAELIQAGRDKAEVASTGSMRSALANAMVGMKAKYYGKGPDEGQGIRR